MCRIRRKTLYYMYNIVFPCMMMSTLTVLVFCMPPDSGEKIALGVTVILAFSVFMLAIAERMPETSESIPLIGNNVEKGSKTYWLVAFMRTKLDIGEVLVTSRITLECVYSQELCNLVQDTFNNSTSFSDTFPKIKLTGSEWPLLT